MSVLRTPLGLTIGVLAAAILGSSSILLFRPETVFLDGGHAAAASSELRARRDVLFEHIEKLVTEKLDLERRIASLDASLAAAADELKTATTERESLAEETQAALAEKAALQESMKSLQVEREGLIQERDSLTGARDGLTAERDALIAQQKALTVERNGLTAQRDTLTAQRDTLTAQRDTLTAQRDTLGKERDALAKEKAEAEAGRIELTEKLRESEVKLAKLDEERRTLIEERDSAKEDRNLLALRVEGFAAQLKELRDRLTLLAPAAEKEGAEAVPEGRAGTALQKGPPRALSAKVAAVNDAEGIVVLDVGEAHGVLEGTRFRIRRDGKPLATVKATRIQKQFSGCRILSRESPESIQAADDADVLTED